MPGILSRVSVGVRFSLLVAGALMVIAPGYASTASHSVNQPLQPDLKRSINQKQIQFIKNQGQKHSDVVYYASAFGGAIFVDKQGALIYSLPDQLKRNTAGWAFKETFIGQNKLFPMAEELSAARLLLQKKQGDPTHSIAGDMASKLSLGEVMPGIEVKLEAKNNNVEKLFYVAPGSDPSKIRVKLDGINGSFINPEGQLVLKTGLGPIVFTKPVAYQSSAGQKENVQITYALRDNQYSFVVGDYDKSRELVIDPLLASTYVGGSGGYPTYSYDSVTAIVSAGDYVYAAGGTHSPDFPTALGYDSTFDWIRDGFILRFTSDLSTLVNATFIGNTVYDIVMDDDGRLVAVGQTREGFPKTAGAYSYPYVYDQSGGFIAKFSADLTELVAGGVVVPAPSLTQVAIGNGSIYFGGRHNSNFNMNTTPGVIGPACVCTVTTTYGIAPFEGFVGRISSDLSTLEVLSYLGNGNLADIAVAPDSTLYVTGTSAYTQGNLVQLDAGVTTALASNEAALTSGLSAVVLGDDFVIAAGSTNSKDLTATSGAFDSTCGTDGVCNDRGTIYYQPFSDAFIVKYSMDLQTVQASTFLGGSNTDYIRVLAMDDTGSIVVAGDTYSSDFPASDNAFDKKYKDSSDVFIAKLSNDLTRLEYSSYIGGSHMDNVYDIETAPGGIVFIAGETAYRDDFPTTSGAFDTSYNGDDSDGFVSKFDTSGSGDSGGNPPPVNNIAPSANAGADQTVSPKTKVTLNGGGSNDSDGSLIAYQWKQLSGKSVSLSNANSAVATFTAPSVKSGRTKTLVFEITVTDNSGATNSDQITITIKG